MAETNIQTLEEAIMLLSKVSSKLATKTNVTKAKESTVEKVTKTKETADKDSKLDKKLDKLVTKLGVIAPEKKPERVIKEAPPVTITDFSKNASKQLINSFKEALQFMPAPEEEQPPKKEGGILSMLKNLLPAALLVLGGLGGFLASLMSGKFGDLWKMVKAGNLSGAFDKAKEIIYQTIKPFLYSLPIIGPIFAFKDGINQLQGGNLVGGITNIVQGVLGLLPLPYGVKAAIMGGVELLGTWIEGKVGKEPLPKGSGADIMAGAVKAIGFVLKPLVKRIPIVGSLISFYEAYESFKIGGAAGVSKGVLNLAAGIANLVPGWGTAISIGLDVISAFLFDTSEQKDASGMTVQKINTREWFKKTIDFIANTFPIKNLMQFGEGIGDIINGDYRQGLLKMGYAIPGMGALQSLLGGADNAESAIKASDGGGVSFADLLAGIRDSLYESIVYSLPEWMGRSAIAKMLGVKIADTGKSKIKLTASKLSAPKMDYEVETPDDFIQTPDGKLIQPNKNDTVIGFKPGGPIDKYFNKTAELTKENNKVLKTFADNQDGLLLKQIDILIKNNKLLAEIAQKLNTPQQSQGTNATVINNHFGDGMSLRSLQALNV